MDLITMLIVVGLSIYASYKMAIGKVQNKVLWPVAAALFGPVPVIVQYVVSDVAKGKREKTML